MQGSTGSSPGPGVAFRTVRAHVQARSPDYVRSCRRWGDRGGATPHAALSKANRRKGKIFPLIPRIIPEHLFLGSSEDCA